MNKEEIKEYLKRVDELELKLTDEDKNTYQWLLFGYNECARLLNEKEQENKQLKAKLEMYENGVYYSSENDKLENEIDNLNYIIDKQDKDITILSRGNKQLKEVIDKAIKLLGNYKHYSTPDEKQNNDNEDLVNNAFDILKGVKTC